jgi:hypothetical protein
VPHLQQGDVMARSHVGLVNMATRFGFRLAKAREGSQHLGRSVRYLQKTKTACCSCAALRW